MLRGVARASQSNSTGSAGSTGAKSATARAAKNVTTAAHKAPAKATVKAPGQPPSVYFVSLGCPKNRVDTEVMLGMSDQAGYALTDAPERADVIVVNTCGFIGAAKEESIDTILEMAEWKKNGSCQRLVVTGLPVAALPRGAAPGDSRDRSHPRLGGSG